RRPRATRYCDGTEKCRQCRGVGRMQEDTTPQATPELGVVPQGEHHALATAPVAEVGAEAGWAHVVVDDGVGGERRAKARRLRPPGQVGVFAVREPELLAETVERLEHLAAVRHVARLVLAG